MAPKRKSTSKAEAAPAEAPAAKRKSTGKAAAKEEAVAEPAEAKPAAAKKAKAGAAAAPAEAKPAAAKKAKAGALAVGDLVPDVELLREDDTAVKLRDLFQDKGGVIFMYPRANTGGCTKQACGFRDKIKEFEAAGFDVYGMSFDKPKSQSNWKTKYELPYHLLTDAEGEVLKAFGALKAAKSILRSHVVVGKGGKLLDVQSGISPGDSFAQAAEFCAANKQASARATNMPSSGAAASGTAAEPASNYIHLHGDLLRRCLQPLAHPDLLTASAVCREWREASQCDLIWAERYVTDYRRSERIVGSRSGGSSLGCPSARLFPQALPQMPDGAADPATATATGDTWRRAYRERSAAEANWRAGRCGWQRLVGHRDYIRCAQLVDGVLASCSGSYLHKDCSIRLWDVGSGECLEHMRGHEGPIWSMHFDGARVASCDDEGSVRLWDLDTHRVGVSTALAPCSLKCIAVDGRQMAAAGESGLLGLWSLARIQQALQEAEESEDADMSGESSNSDVGDESDEEDGPPRHRLPAWRPVTLDSAAGAAPARARAPQLHILANPAPDTSCLQLDGGLCATGDSGADGQVHLWSTEDDEPEFKRSLTGHPQGVATLSFQRETGWLVAGSGGGPVKVWSMERSKLVHDLRGHAAGVLCHQQSGALLASGGADCALRLWDLRAGRAQAVVPLGSLPYCLQMDDRRLAVGCGSGTVQLIDLRRPASSVATSSTPSSSTSSSGEGGKQGAAPSKLPARTVLPAHRERVWALALDETRLVSASLDASIVVRSFMPADVAAHEARRLEEGDSEAEDSELELGSEDEAEMDEAGSEEGDDSDSEAGSAADMESDGDGSSQGDGELAAAGGWDSEGEGQGG